MKTQICIILISLVPSLGLAKLDLSESISESAQEQHALSADTRARAKQVRSIASAPRDRIVVVEVKGAEVTAPMDDSLNKYEKEGKSFTASHEDQMNRLDNELNSLGK